MNNQILVRFICAAMVQIILIWTLEENVAAITYYFAPPILVALATVGDDATIDLAITHIGASWLIYFGVVMLFLFVPQGRILWCMIGAAAYLLSARLILSPDLPWAVMGAGAVVGGVAFIPYHFIGHPTDRIYDQHIGDISLYALWMIGVGAVLRHYVYGRDRNAAFLTESHRLSRTS